jgi:hypothetical protein
MRKIREILRLLWECKLSQRQAATGNWCAAAAYFYVYVKQLLGRLGRWGNLAARCLAGHCHTRLFVHPVSLRRGGKLTYSMGGFLASC